MAPRAGSADDLPGPDRPGWATTDIHLAVLTEGSAGPALIPLVEHSTTDGLNGAAYRLLPDGAGGLLVAHRATAAVRRIDAAGTLGPHVPLVPAGIYTATYEAEYVLGETEAYALVKGPCRRDPGPYSSECELRLEVVLARV